MIESEDRIPNCWLFLNTDLWIVFDFMRTRKYKVLDCTRAEIAKFDTLEEAKEYVRTQTNSADFGGRKDVFYG